MYPRELPIHSILKKTDCECIQLNIGKPFKIYWHLPSVEFVGIARVIYEHHFDNHICCWKWFLYTLLHPENVCQQQTEEVKQRYQCKVGNINMYIIIKEY